MTANDPGDKGMLEIRLVLVGSRWAGKSSSGNTLLQGDRFECGRIRTGQPELRHGEVEGRTLVVVDAPGWSSSLSLTEIPEVDKQRFKLNPSKCSPGPHVILLVIPIDTAFSLDKRRTLEEHMKLLGERVWRYTMVLFTCGDYLGEKSIEQHIESEGQPLQWLINKCHNRYHVFNNKDRTNPSQVLLLLEKIEELVQYNHDTYYQTDQQTLKAINDKRQRLVEQAKKRREVAEEQRLQMKHVSDATDNIPKLNMILLGSRKVGKTSVGNTILGLKEHNDSNRTAQSVSREGLTGKCEVNVVDTPGWWRGFSAADTPAAIKEEIMMSMFLCHPGPHVFLLVLDADASFNGKHLEAVKSHMELLGEGIWRHVIIVFTRGDWLGTHTIEEFIEGEGAGLQSLVELGGNRYHVVDTKYKDKDTQMTELLQMIVGTVAQNDWRHFKPDQRIQQTIKEKRKKVEESAKRREKQVKEKRKSLRGSRNKLEELTIILLGLKTSGKTATANNLLRKVAFPTCQNECSLTLVDSALIADRHITVIDTPGWGTELCPRDPKTDREIFQALSRAPQGVHAVLLVVPLDLTFREVHQGALQEHMSLFDDSLWRHTILVFTYGDTLADRSVEEHIDSEHSALGWLVDKCKNRYHVISNVKKGDFSQFVELLEKVEDMVSENKGRLFNPDMNEIHKRIEERLNRGQLKHVLKRKLEEEYMRREVELKKAFRQTLVQLQKEIRANGIGTKPKIHVKGIGQKKRDEKEKDNISAKISQEIEHLDEDMRAYSLRLYNSKEFLLPDMSGENPSQSTAESAEMTGSANFHKVLHWLSSLKLGTNVDNQFTLNFSQTTSGYRTDIISNFDTELDM